MTYLDSSLAKSFDHFQIDLISTLSLSDKEELRNIKITGITFWDKNYKDVNSDDDDTHDKIELSDSGSESCSDFDSDCTSASELTSNQRHYQRNNQRNYKRNFQRIRTGKP